MKITILVKSSGGDPYSVDFVFKNDRLTVFCNCKAGIFGQICKHKLSLLSNDTSMLFEPDQAGKLSRAMELIEKTQYPQLVDELRAKERDSERAKREVKKAKVLLAKVMKEGLAPYNIPPMP